MTIFNIRNLLFTLRPTFASEDNEFNWVFIICKFFAQEQPG